MAFNNRGNPNPSPETRFKKGHRINSKDLLSQGIPQKWKGLAKEKLNFTMILFRILQEEKEVEGGVKRSTFEFLARSVVDRALSDPRILMWLINSCFLQDNHEPSSELDVRDIDPDILAIAQILTELPIDIQMKIIELAKKEHDGL